jgi:hypothetical protein
MIFHGEDTDTPQVCARRLVRSALVCSQKDEDPESFSGGRSRISVSPIGGMWWGRVARVSSGLAVIPLCHDQLEHRRCRLRQSARNLVQRTELTDPRLAKKRKHHARMLACTSGIGASPATSCCSRPRAWCQAQRQLGEGAGRSTRCHRWPPRRNQPALGPTGRARGCLAYGPRARAYDRAERFGRIRDERRRGAPRSGG